MTVRDLALAPLPALLCAQAGRAADGHRLLWAFDERLAHIAQTTREPMIGQMRLTWWHDAITDAAGIKGRGEPILDDMRATRAIMAPGLIEMIDGWEALIVEPDLDRDGLRDYAAGRGGGLFRALADAGDAPDWLISAGMIWALWDLSGHSSDAMLADRAIALARELVPGMAEARWPRGWRPLRIAFQLAAVDVRRGRRAPPALTRALTLRFMRIALVGR